MEDGLIEERSDADSAPKSSKYWLMEIGLAQTDEEQWHNRADIVVETYRDEPKGGGANLGKTFNILWSNTDTLKPALYARTAKPDVRRRYSDQDPTGRQVSELIERALEYSVDQYDIDPVMESVVEDQLLPGRGVARVVYEADVQEADYFDPLTGEMQKLEFIADQKAECEYVYWRDFLISPARTWAEVKWVAFRHLMTREEVKEISPEHAAKVPLGHSVGEGGDATEEGVPDTFKRCEVWELWDKKKRERVWVVKGYPFLLAVEDDPYGLEKFFPVPEPLYGVKTNKNLVPIPEYTIYQDQAKELNVITTRIDKLIDALKRRGVYDSTLKEALSKIQNAGDNEFFPVDNMSALNEKGGLAAAMQSEDITPIVSALASLYQQRDQLLDTIYQVTGISDIIRGASDARETATAQRIKGQFGGMRLQSRQRRVQRFVRDLYRLKAELMVEHFEPQILTQMTQVEITPEMQELMQSDRLRSYHVDIETDSTVFEDTQEERSSRSEWMAVFTKLIVEWGPIVQQAPEMMAVAKEAIMFTLRPYTVGRTLEGAIDNAFASMGERAQQGGQDQPDPKVIEAQQKMQIEMAKLQQRQEEIAAKIGLEERKVEVKAETERQKQAVDAELARDEMQMDATVRMRGQDIDAATKQVTAQNRMVN